MKRFYLLKILILSLIGIKVNAQATYVPDDNFEQALINLGYDDALDDYVPTTHIEGVTDLYIFGLGITDLTGIEDFAALELLFCYNNNLETIDVSSNANLLNLKCYGNNLTSLDVSANTALQYLYCHDNNLTYLNLKNGINTAIRNTRSFAAYGNPDLKCIQVDDPAYSEETWLSIDEAASFSTNCETFGLTYVPDDAFEQALIDLEYDTAPIDDYVPTALIEVVIDLYISDINITDMTGIEGFTALTNLTFGDTGFTSIDLSYNKALETLKFYTELPDAMTITSLDLSANTLLTSLICNAKSLTSINVANNTALTHLDCSQTGLTNLDVSNSTALTYLNCSRTSLTSLDVRNNTLLTKLSCLGNNLTSLDVSNNTLLTELSCRNNNLTSLDVSNNKALTFLNCDNNNLTNLNVKNGNNANSTLFSAEFNPDLECIQVDNVAFSIENWGYIDEDASFSTNCETFGLTYVPDNAFEQALIDLGKDNVLDDYVSTDSINTITLLDVSRLEIVDLTGIEDFTALTDLICHNNNLISLDVSSNKKLIRLSCYKNSIRELDMSSNSSLNRLYCQGNNLTRLNLQNGNNKNIKRFTSNFNPDLRCIQVDDVLFMQSMSLFIKPDLAYYSLDCETPEPAAKGNSLKKSTISTNAVQDVTGNQELDYTMYLNPVTNILNIKSTRPIDAINVVNIQGAIVLTRSTSKIDFSNLPPNIYIVHITSGNQSAYKKIVKK